MEVLACLPSLETTTNPPGDDGTNNTPGDDGTDNKKGDGGVAPDPATLDQMFEELVIDLDSDGFVNARELWLINLPNKTEEIREWLTMWQNGEIEPPEGRGRARISEQAWLTWSSSNDDIVKTLRDR